jgi:G patch domain-containing protein 1
MKEMGLQPDDDDEGEDDEEAKKHTFAPLDRTVLTFENKDNQWGLGYMPGQSLTGRLEEQQLNQPGSYSIPTSDEARFGRNGQKGDKGPQSRMPVGGAFGISALEDADEDDLDVYGAGSSAPRSMVLNDEDEDDDAFAGASLHSRRPELLKWNDRRKGDTARPGKTEAFSARETPQVFNDGSPMLPGFVLASRIQPPDKW